MAYRRRLYSLLTIQVFASEQVYPQKVTSSLLQPHESQDWHRYDTQLTSSNTVGNIECDQVRDVKLPTGRALSRRTA